MKYFFLLIAFILVSSGLTGQNNITVKGFVYDKSNGEPVPFSNVYLKGTTLGSNTDLNGFFSINRVPPGDYVIMVTNLDFDTIRETISVKAGDQISKKFFTT